MISSATLLGQSIEVIDWEMNVIVPADESPYEVAVSVENTASDTLNIRVSSEVMSIINGTDYRFCWGPLCYNWTTDDFTSSDSEALMPALAPGEVNSTFYTDYRHDGIEGLTTIEYCWFDNDNTADEICATLNWCVGDDCSTILGIDEHAKGAISAMSPNPVTETGKFTFELYNQPNTSEIVIYNLIGEEVQRMNLESKVGFVLINASDFESGLYFYSLVVDGQVAATQKVLIAD